MGNLELKEEERVANVVESFKAIDILDDKPIIAVNSVWTKNSLLCNIMHTHPNTWREFMKEEYKCISIKEDGKLAIFNYSIGANFSDPVVREARGIIIDTRFHKVVCRPFSKFFKYDEPNHHRINWKHARADEKIDGSLIKLWYNYIDNEWVFSTNSNIYAKYSPLNLNTNLTFLDAIKSADNYGMIECLIEDEELNKDYTYMFELIGRGNQVVIKYDTTRLYHIGTRNNNTGEEYDIDLGIVRPNRQYVNSLDFCINYVSNVLNTSNKKKITGCSSEGLVVVDDNFNRIKVKSPIYVILHNLINNGETSKKQLLLLIHEDKIDIDSVCKQFPNMSHWIRYYSFKYDEFAYQVNSFVSIVRKLYEESTYNRKLVAERIKGHKYASIAFKALDNSLTVEEIMNSMTGGFIHQLCKFIPNYEPENYGYLFG